MLNLNDATTNSSQLSSTQIGAANVGLSNTGTAGLGTGALNSADVTAGGVQAAGQGSFFKNGDGSFNSDSIGMVIGGIQTLGSLWNSYQQHKIAKEQIGLQREAFRTNLENNTQTYNTALEDRIRSRHNFTGQGEGDTQAYLEENKL